MPRFVAFALVVGIVAACGSASVQPSPTSAPSPTGAPSSASAPLLARGTFKLYGVPVELDAVGDGGSAAGTMTVRDDDGSGFHVELQCSRTTADGLILIAGDITASTSAFARQGARQVIVLKPGTPVLASFDSEGREGGDVRPASSCPALLEQVIETGTQTVVGPNGLEPIEGTVAFGP